MTKKKASKNTWQTLVTKVTEEFENEKELLQKNELIKTDSYMKLVDTVVKEFGDLVVNVQKPDPKKGRWDILFEAPPACPAVTKSYLFRVGFFNDCTIGVLPPMHAAFSGEDQWTLCTLDSVNTTITHLLMRLIKHQLRWGALA